MTREKRIWLIAAVVLAGAYLFWKFAGSGFRVSEFHPFVNYKSKDNSIAVDLTDAVYRGIEIPTVKQLPGGKFIFSFKAKNKSLFSQKLYYKIYYQDETYKFVEFEVKNKFNYENPLSSRNFYGSWGETDPGFKATPSLSWNEEQVITDSFRIVGNPRNEEVYFGKDDRGGLSSVKIANMINYIHSREDWMAEIQEKAKNNGISIEQQVYRDAVWQIDNVRKLGETNNRWKRNPRTGAYKFMLVVTTEGGMNSLPESVRNITKRENDGRFINPFYYFLYGTGSIDGKSSILVAEEQLHVKASFNPGSGIYVDPFEFIQAGIDTAAFCPTCGTDSSLFRKAQFSQFYYYEDRGHILPTVPLAYDVTGDNYTQKQYEENRDYYSPESVVGHPDLRLNDWIRNGKRPCETVTSNPVSNSIFLSNPGNKEAPYRKENVGVRSRIGFTYGKFRVCADFPELLSKDHVWNGLSNSVWLLYQDDLPWNSRRDCSPGFIPKDDPRAAKAVKVPVVNYSEIDMEMVKSSRNWPYSSYGEGEKPDDDFAANTDDIMVACSNWDLACMEPKHYVTGAVPTVFEKHTFVLHRWDSWYKAVTLKTPENDDELFKNHSRYWYEIEWAPDHITWRVGPDKTHMRVVGYMSSDYTVIPDNQMSLIVSQKFPDSDWWVPAPYDQRYIPYPKNPLTGEIIAVEVE
jgi:hypothetical protein